LEKPWKNNILGSRNGKMDRAMRDGEEMVLVKKLMA